MTSEPPARTSNGRELNMIIKNTLKITGAIAAVVCAAAACGNGQPLATPTTHDNSGASPAVSRQTQDCTSSGGTWDGTACTTPSPTPSTSPAEADDATWLAGPGGDLLNQVESDLGQIAEDADNADADVAAMEQDGHQLSKDAAAGSASPPPFQTAEYVTAMSHLITAGEELANDDFNSADAEVNTGGAMIKAMTDAMPSS